MVHGLDPHSDFLDAEAFRELQVGTQGKFGGLGIEVGVEDGFVQGRLADRGHARVPRRHQGRRPDRQDRRIATRGMPLERGGARRCAASPGTPIVLTVVRKDVDKPLTFTLTREEINVKSVRAKMIEPGYGYMRVAPVPGAHRRGPRQGDQGPVQARRPQGAGARPAQRPGRPAQRGGRRSRPRSCRRMRWSSTPTAARPRRACASRAHQGQLHARRGDDYLRGPAAGGEDRADGGAGRRRHGVGVGNRRRRAAGPQARRS